MDKLKPCQCGKEAELEATDIGYTVNCTGDKCDIGLVHVNWTEKGAIEIWNTRTPDIAALEARIEQLECHNNELKRLANEAYLDAHTDNIADMVTKLQVAAQFATPAQSLAEHDAKAVREFAKWCIEKQLYDFDADISEGYLSELRQQERYK